MSIKEEIDLQSLSSNSSSDILYCSGTFELDVDLNQTQSLSTSSTLSLESDLDQNTLTYNKNNNKKDQTSINDKKNRLTIDVNILKNERLYDEELEADDTYDDLFLDYKSSLSYDSDNEKEDDEDENKVSLLDVNHLLYGTSSKTDYSDDIFIHNAIGESEYPINENFQLLYDTDDSGISADDLLDETIVERDYNTFNFPSLLENDDQTNEDQLSQGQAMKLDDDDTLDLSDLLEKMIEDDFSFSSDANAQMHPWDIMFCKGRESSEGNQDKELLLGDNLTHTFRRSFLKFEFPKNSMKARKTSRNLVDLLVHKVFEKIKSSLFEKHYVPFESSSGDCEYHNASSSSKNGNSLKGLSSKDHATAIDFVQFETSRDLWAIEERDDENCEFALPVNDVCRKLDFEDVIEPFVYEEKFKHEGKVKSPVKTRIANNRGQDKTLSQSRIATNQNDIVLLESQGNDYSTPMNEKLCLTYETEKKFNFDEVDSAIEVMLSGAIPLIPKIEDFESPPQVSGLNHLNTIQSDKTSHTEPSFSSSIMSLTEDPSTSSQLSKHFASLAVKDEITHTEMEPSDSSSTDDQSVLSNTVSKLINSLADKDKISTTEGDDAGKPPFSSQSVKELRAYFEQKLGLTSKSTAEKVSLHLGDKSSERTDTNQAKGSISGQVDISSKPIGDKNDDEPVLVRKKLTQAHQTPQFPFMSLRFPQSIQKQTLVSVIPNKETKEAQCLDTEGLHMKSEISTSNKVQEMHKHVYSKSSPVLELWAKAQANVQQEK